MNTLARYKKHTLLCLVFVICMLTPQGNSYPAATATKMLVSATVVNNCRVNANAIQFGTYNPVSSNVNSGLSAQSDISIQCTNGTNADITIDNGSNQGLAGNTSRAMKGGSEGEYLGYDIYQDAAKSSIWSASESVQYTATNSATGKFAVYAYIPANQQVSDGNYSDVVTVTVTY